MPQERPPLSRRVAFGRALAAARVAADLTQAELGKRLDGLTQNTISNWELGKSPPSSPDEVFRVERAIPVPPGTLSVHYGYLPPEAVEHVADVESAIRTDPYVSDEAKETLLAAYEAARKVAGRQPRRI